MVKLSYSLSLLALASLAVAVLASPVAIKMEPAGVVATEPTIQPADTQDDAQDDIDALTKSIAALQVSDPFPYRVGQASDPKHILRANPPISPQIGQINWDLNTVLSHLGEKDPTGWFYCIRQAFIRKEQAFINARGVNKGFLKQSYLAQHINDKKLVVGYIRSHPTGPLEVKVLYNPLRYSTNILDIVENDDEKRFMMYIAYDIHKQADKTLYMGGLKRLMLDLLDAQNPTDTIPRKTIAKLYRQGIPLVLDMVKNNDFRTLMHAELAKA